MKGLSRRRFLALSGAAAALAACGEGKRRAPTPPASPSVTAVSRAPVRGGVLRTYNFDALPPETLDPHIVRGGPIVNVHSAVFSKLLRYEDEVAGTIVPDLAAGLPEQPDELTYVFSLREGVMFHDTEAARLAFPATAGRALVAGDVRYSIERQATASRAQPAGFVRGSQFRVIDRVETPDDRTVVIKLKAPVAPFISFLAGRHAFVLAREVIDVTTGEANSPGSTIGTGPFTLASFEPGVAVRLRRNEAWFAREDARGGGGAARPYLAGYDAFLSPQQDLFQREAFENRVVDSTGFLDPGALDQARTTNLADIVVERADGGGVLASRLLLDRPPFSDDRLRRAVHLAIDRRALMALLYAPVPGEPSARLSGPIAPAMRRWALDDEDLLSRPGYADRRAEAIAEAKQLWSSAVGDTPVAELRVVFSGVPRTIPDLAIAAVQRQLSEALGVSVVPQIDPSGGALIASALRLNLEGATEGAVTFTFALEDGGVDLDDWVYAQFRSGEAGNTYRLQDPTLDAMLDGQRSEFDEDARRELGFDIQEYLLGNVNARLDYLAPVTRRLSWGYVRNSRLAPWHGSDFHLADVWLDAAHTAWVGRPA